MHWRTPTRPCPSSTVSGSPVVASTAPWIVSALPRVSRVVVIGRVPAPSVITDPEPAVSIAAWRSR